MLTFLDMMITPNLLDLSLLIVFSSLQVWLTYLTTSVHLLFNFWKIFQEIAKPEQEIDTLLQELQMHY